MTTPHLTSRHVRPGRSLGLLLATGLSLMSAPAAAQEASRNKAPKPSASQNKNKQTENKQAENKHENKTQARADRSAPPPTNKRRPQTAKPGKKRSPKANKPEPTAPGASTQGQATAQRPDTQPNHATKQARGGPRGHVHNGASEKGKPGTARQTADRGQTKAAARPKATCVLKTKEAPRGGRLEVTGSRFGKAALVRIAGQVTRLIERTADTIAVQIPAKSNGGPVTLQVGKERTPCGQLTIIGLD